MDVDKDALRKESLTSKKMEKSAKLKETSKVKLKVVKKKVHMRQYKSLNRSNSSFNSSLNASTKMKQTLRSNNRALAHALQVAKQDLALATNIISSLRLDNRNLMLDAANNKYMASHCLEEQVGARLKPILMMIKQKVSDIGEHLTIVTSTVQEISESIVTYLSTSAANSRSNSIQIGQNIEKTPTETPNEKVLLDKDAMDDVALKMNVNSQICNGLSFIAETFMNTDYTSNTLDVLSKVDELESEKLCKNADKNQDLNVPIEKPKIATKSHPDVERRSSIEFRRQSLDEIDFGTTLPTTRKKRRSSFLFSATGLDKNLHQQLDILKPSVIKDSCAEVNLENATVNENSSESSDRDKVVQNNSNHIPCTDASVLNGKTSETALQVDDADNGLNNAIPNSTINGEVDMELTEIINNTDIMHESSQNLPIGNDVHTSDMNLGKQKDTTVAKETFVKPAKVPNKVKSKGNKKSLKSSKDKKEDEGAICVETDENENKTVIELRLPKPGKIIFSATRKNFSGIRPSAPKVRSKKKINEEKKEKEEPKSLFDFHDKTPQLLNKKDIKDEGIYNVSLNDSTYGKCQNLGQYRERVAMAKEKKKEEITAVEDNSEKIINDNRTVSRISDECNEERMKLSQCKKLLTKDQPVAKKKSRSRKKIDDDEDYENLYKCTSTCETNVPERTLSRRTRSKVVSYAEVDESFDVSAIKAQTTPETNKNCQKTTTTSELLDSDKIHGSMKQSENSKISNKNSLKLDSEMVISSPQSSKVKISELSNSNSKPTMNELHRDRTQKHSKQNEKLEEGNASSLKPSSTVNDILERYRKALQDDDISTNVPLRRNGRSSSHIRRKSLANSTTENASIGSSKHRSRSASSVKAGNNSGTESCNSDEKMLSDLLSAKITKEKKKSRSSKGKIGELEQEISRKNVKSQSTKPHRNVPEKTEDSREKTPDLINADDILKIKKDVNSKVKGKATLICEMKENIDVPLTDLPSEATSRNTNPLSPSKNSSKRLSEDNYEDTFGVKRPRRTALKSISYREPALNSKLRQGDALFLTKALENGNFVCKDEVKKRNALENVTNMN